MIQKGQIPSEFDQVPQRVWNAARYEAARADSQVEDTDTLAAFRVKDKFLKKPYYEAIGGRSYERYYAKIDGHLWEVAQIF